MPKTPPQRTRIDWAIARAAYIALDPTERSFARIARDFRVSSVTVRKHAHAERWVELAEKADRAAAEKAIRAAVRSRDQRVAHALRLVDRAMEGFDKRMPDLVREAKLSDLPPLVKLAELLEGEATDRIAVGEVQVMIQALLGYVGGFVPADRRAEFLAGLPDVIGELPGSGSVEAA